LANRVERGSRARNRPLSAREKEVLTLLSQGLTGVEIAQRLYLSPETVRTHVRNAMTKLNASTRAHAIALSIKSGEISLSDV
jgi:DNA-binding CsgD family transcriptional regulator